MNEVMERPAMAITMSQTIAKFSAAFVKAQAAMGAAVKGKSNPFFKSKYADLAEVIEVCKGPLNDNGIAVLQPVVNVATPTNEWRVPQELVEFALKAMDKIKNDDFLAAMDALFGSRPRPKTAVSTLLLHESGEWMACTAEFPTVKEDPQAYFATTTYLRRASLQAILGIPAEDDDGNTAAGRAKKEEGNPLAKAMYQDFPPGELLRGTLLRLVPPQGAEPAGAVIQMANNDLSTTYIVYGDEQRYASMVGCEVEYRYEKKPGAKWILTEMCFAPKPAVKQAIEVQAPIAAQAQAADDDQDLPIDQDALTAYAARFKKGMVLDAQAKESKRGPYYRLNIGGVWGSVWHSPGHFGFDSFEELAETDVFYTTSESPGKNGGKPFITFEEIVPEDVFEQYVISKISEVSA